MNCLIVDESQAAQKQLTDFIGQLPQLNLKANCFSAYEALEALQQHNIDLVFLDTQLSRISGLEFARNLVGSPLVVITSPTGQYAVEAFNIDAVDYLVKPIGFERFLKTVQKAGELYYLRKLRTGRSEGTAAFSDPPHGFILIKADYNTIKINIEDILFVEGLKDYVKIYTTDARKPVITRNSLKKIHQALPAGSFSRVHKSYIISLNHITSINKAQVIIGESHIPIGESYKSLFLSKLENRIL